MGRLLLSAFVAASVIVPAPQPSPAAAQPTTSAFVAVESVRLADTREGFGFQRLDERTIRVATGVDAVAVLVRITLVGDGHSEFASAWPAGQPRPLVAATNSDRSQPVSGTTQIVRTGEGGAIDVYASKGSPLVVDLSGYFVAASSATAGRFVSTGPSRLVDTRDAGAPVADGAPLVVPLPDAVPPDALALAVNITVVGVAPSGFAVAVAAGAPPPATSSVNWTGVDVPVPSAAVVPAAPEGLAIWFSAAAHVIVDLQGWFTGPSAPDSTDGLFVPLDTPRRQLDTRTPEGGGRIIYGGSTTEIPGFAGGAAAGTVTVTDPVTSGFVTLRAAGAERPLASNLNTQSLFQVASNSFISPVSARGLAAYASAGAHVIVDQSGWFTGTAAPVVLPPESNSIAAPIPELPAGPCDAEIGDLGLGSPEKAPRYVVIGTSSAGQAIVAEHWGSDTGPQIMVVSMIHGDECPAARLAVSFRANPPAGYGVWIIDALNPDGYATGNRLTGDLTDLNRDGFNQTQPETRALMVFTFMVRPVLTLHAHAPYGEILWWGPGYPNFAGAPVARRIAQRVSFAAGGALRMAGAGSNPPSSAYLWQGMAAAGGSEAVLIEFPPTSPNTAPQITSRRAREMNIGQIDGLVREIRTALAGIYGP